VIRRDTVEPIALRIVDVRQGLEGQATVDHRQGFAKVLPHSTRKVEAGALAELARIE